MLENRVARDRVAMLFLATIRAGLSDSRGTAVSFEVPLPRAGRAVSARDSAEARPPTFAEVFEGYAAYVLGLLPRLRVPAADVQDVAQEVFLAIAQGLPRFEQRSSVKTWVCGICLRKASDHLRKLARRREAPEGSGGEAVDPGEPHGALLRRERALRLQAALATLPEPQLQVFVLYEIEELPMAEVARALGCARFTAYTRLRAARSRVRECFERDERARRSP
jgi:RNA polymerase sigma-70 factor, ECF subfamily